MSDVPEPVPSRVPLFPLPGTVLFPGTMLPLHIFEPRYCAMVADALAGERCIAIALLKDGYQPLYYTRTAPIHPIVGVGNVVATDELADGKYNILLHGVARARIVAEPETDRLYRIVEIERLWPIATIGERGLALRHELRSAIEQSASPTELREHWIALSKKKLSLGELTDLVASTMPVDSVLRMALLAELDDAARAGLLMEFIRTHAAVTRQHHSAERDGGWHAN